MVKGAIGYHVFLWFDNGILPEGETLEVGNSAIFIIAAESALFADDIQMTLSMAD